MEFPLHHHAPALISQCTFVFFCHADIIYLLGHVVNQMMAQSQVCSHTRAGTSGSEESERKEVGRQSSRTENAYSTGSH